MYIDISGFDMSFETQAVSSNTVLSTNPLHAFLELRRSLLEYRIIIGIMKGNVSGANLLGNALRASKDLGITEIVLALGPTSPVSLDLPPRTKILWATFLDEREVRNKKNLRVVAPNHLVDLSVSLDELCRKDGSSIRLIVGDFLDNVLSASTASLAEDVFIFLCKLFARIRENGQTAFFLASEDMHDAKKIATLKRFADVVIEYRSAHDNADYHF